MTCQQSKCADEATTEVFWPGQTTRQCDKHAADVVRLGAFMGTFVETRPLPPDPAVPPPTKAGEP